MPPFLFVAIVLARWIDPPLQISQAIECIEGC
jgi:hypothetical protein